MKTILEFDQTDSEDLYFAQHGACYAVVLSELDSWLRSMSKYESKETVDINEVRGRIVDLKCEYGVK